MAKHEFGIMKNEPMYEDRFDEYDPYKYNNCIVEIIIKKYKFHAQKSLLYLYII